MVEQIGLDRLTGIIAFARAASLGSYTSAARSLSVSPSAVSKSVQRLEDHLGIKLFTRTTRSLTLTAEGRDLHERALRLLREAEEIEQAAFAARAEPAGLLKVTAPLPIGVHLIAPQIPAFRERFPKVAIDLRLSDQYIDIVEHGIDVAIRVGEIGDTRLIARKLAPNRICAFASPAYMARRGIPARPEDLVGHDCINFRYQSSGQPLRWPFRIGDRVLEVIPPASVVVDNSDAVAAVTAAGGGIGMTPTYIAAPYLERGQLVPVLKDYAIDRFDIIAFWPDSRRGNPTVKAFVSFLTEMCPSPTAWDDIFERAAAAAIAVRPSVP
jgi:DNA-binding transcriptional LysR family regulator